MKSVIIMSKNYDIKNNYNENNKNIILLKRILF